MPDAPPNRSPEEVWARYDAMEARLTAPLSERMLDLACVGRGMRVLDLATGRGEPAIPAAQRVGPTGTVLGVDVSPAMLELARARAEREGVTNLELRVADAAGPGILPVAAFDVALCRWGLMYMAAPVAALSAARRALVPGGFLALAVWSDPARVPYFTLPRRVLARYRMVPAIDPDAPGTFRHADPARLRVDLDAAGLRIEHAEELDVTVMEARTPDALVAWVRAFGLDALVAALPGDAQRAWERELVAEAAPFLVDGVYRLGGVTRIVVTREGAPAPGT